MPIQNTNMFKTQSPYEQQIEEMKRRQQMAEMLQQQALQPLESQVAPGGMVVPTSPVLGLTKMLQAYMGGKQLRDIEKQRGEREQLEGNKAMNFLKDIRMGQQQPMSADDALGASLSVAPTEAQRMPMSAMDKQGAMDAAMLGGSPQMRMAAQLAAMKPEEPEAYDVKYETGSDGKTHAVQYSKTGKRIDLGVSNPYEKPTVASKPTIQRKTRTSFDANGNEFNQDYNFNPETGDETLIGKPYSGKPNADGTGKPKEPTQGEKQDAYNVSRIVNAVGRINKALVKDPSAIAPSMMEGPASMVGAEGLAQSGPRQIIAGAQADALDAMLYLATGATYTETQLNAAKAAYMPRYFDDPATKLDKQEALRNLVVEGKKRAGRGWSPEAESSFNEVFGLKNTSQPNAQVPIVSPFSDPLKEAAYQAHKRNKPGSGVLR